jgi:seryl-tRNA synthetase
MSPLEIVRTMELGKAKLAIYETMCNDMLDEAQKLIVTDESTHKRAVEIGTKSKKLGKEISDRVSALIGPAKDYVNGMRGIAKPFEEVCKRIEAVTKEKNRQYLSLKEVERLSAEKAMREATAVVQEKVNQESARAGVQAPTIPAVTLKQEKQVTRTESGSANLRKGKDFSIVNLALIPRQILEASISVDPKKFLGGVIREEIKRGVEEIPGVLIFDTEDVVYRTN